MISYYCVLALQSLRRRWGLTLLMVLTISCGVAASMTTFSIFRAMSGDPIPWKSDKLFFPQLDVWGPQGSQPGGEPPTALTYVDAVAFRDTDHADKQSAIYAISAAVLAESQSAHPLEVGGYAVDSDFFTMLDVPFQYGAGWSKKDDTAANPIVVLSEKLNRQLFGDMDSIGKSVNINGTAFTVIGVIRHWDPQPRYYDVSGSGAFSRLDNDIFIPFATSIDRRISNTGSMACVAHPRNLTDGCAWISYMVELDSPMSVSGYRNYLYNYAKEQEHSGRFAWSPNIRLRNLTDWLAYRRVVPADTKVSVLLALGLFAICLVNTASLLLAKFLARGGEVGVRRALGATRGAVCKQFLTEAGLVGLLGGVLGFFLTNAALSMASLVLPPKIAELTLINAPLMLATVVVAVAATVMAGIYPAVKASGVQPAWQLKIS